MAGEAAWIHGAAGAPGQLDVRNAEVQFAGHCI
jgi:hypothetical protein